MFCSTIIATIARPTLTRSVLSVLEQRFEQDEFEVIVVNDSGQALPSADWQHSPHVRILDTGQRERSVARNAGASIARGRYLHFLDDDDWLESHALQTWWELAGRSDAAWLYSSTQLVNRDGRALIQLHHGLQGNCFLQVLAGEWIPLQASVIRAEVFFNLGGFHPLLAGPEDVDLLRRVALHYDLAGVETVVANVIMGQSGSTTDYEAHAGHSRRARERILDDPAAFPRLRSAAQDAYGHGRIARAYLTSAVWNARHGRPLAAAGRAWTGVRGALRAGRHLLSPPFWQAVARPYHNETFARGQRQAAQVAT